MLVSPITENPEVSFEYEIPTDYIVNGWKEGDLGMDVSKTFQNVESVKVYRCKETGYRFFHPFDVAGDSLFYEKLQENDWYYMPWKWEHQKCAELIKEKDRILEVGCGEGAFIKRIAKEKGVQCIGLELNEATAMATEELKIYNETIQNYSKKNLEGFEMVCSFQVLEHIASVKSFMSAQIEALKPGGLLVIGVPNNDAFIKYNKFELLNMPPHHMGLWDEKALRELARYFDLKVKDILFEPLQPHHYNYYFRLTSEHYFGEYIWSKVIRRLYKYGMKKLVDPYLANRAEKIKGHTILAILEK